MPWRVPACRQERFVTEDFQARLSRLDPARRALMEKLQQRSVVRPAAADLP